MRVFCLFVVWSKFWLIFSAWLPIDELTEVASFGKQSRFCVARFKFFDSSLGFNRICWIVDFAGELFIKCWSSFSFKLTLGIGWYDSVNAIPVNGSVGGLPHSACVRICLSKVVRSTVWPPGSNTGFFINANVRGSKSSLGSAGLISPVEEAFASEFSNVADSGLADLSLLSKQVLFL